MALPELLALVETRFKTRFPDVDGIETFYPNDQVKERPAEGLHRELEWEVGESDPIAVRDGDAGRDWTPVTLVVKVFTKIGLSPQPAIEAAQAIRQSFSEPPVSEVVGSGAVHYEGGSIAIVGRTRQTPDFFRVDARIRAAIEESTGATST